LRFAERGYSLSQNEYFSANCRILAPPEVGPEPAEPPEPLLLVDAFAALHRILPKVVMETSIRTTGYFDAGHLIVKGVLPIPDIVLTFVRPRR